MELNEKIALLAKVGVIMPEGNESDINAAIVDYFAAADQDSHEFLLKASASAEDILEAAVSFIQKSMESGPGASPVLSADPYTSADASGSANANTSISVSGGAAKPPAEKTAAADKKTTNKDVTYSLAGTLPKAQRDTITSVVSSKWAKIMASCNSTSIAAYCVDTPVRESLIDKSFTINSEEYMKAFKEKYTPASVVDDNEYGAAANGEKPPVAKEGDNMRAYNEILRKIESGSAFKVRVPEIHNQKIIGVLLQQNIDTSAKEFPLAMKDVPIHVLTEFGGKIPGQPGIVVTGITSRTSKKSKNGTVDTEEKQSITIKHKGKAVAMKSEPAKFIRYTADPMDEAAAQKEYGAPKKDYSVSSVDSFKYKDKEGKVHVMRVRGKIQVPYFSRKQEFASFGPIAAANRVEKLTEADQKNVAMLFAAAVNSPFLGTEVSGALGLDNLIADIEKSDAVPDFNAAVAGIA